MTPELKDMIDAASRQIEKLFARRGQVFPMWHAVPMEGPELVFAPPRKDKDEALAMVRALFDLNNVVRCIFIDEAWMAGPELTEAEEKQAAEHGVVSLKKKHEIVMFCAEDHNGTTMARRTIIRPKGKKAYLGPLEFFPEGMCNSFEGRMAHMLPTRIKGTIQ
jgi:hypothetical protein